MDYDYILFNQDGSIKRTKLTQFIQRGNNDVNKIYIGFENSLPLDVATCYALFKLPDDSVAGPISGTYTEEQESDGDYVGYLFSLNEEVTQYAGQVMMTIYLADLNHKVLYTYPVTLTVNDTTVSPPDYTNITLAQYMALLESLGNYMSKTEGNSVFGDNTFNGETDFEGVVCFDKAATFDDVVHFASAVDFTDSVEFNNTVIVNGYLKGSNESDHLYVDDNLLIDGSLRVLGSTTFYPYVTVSFGDSNSPYGTIDVYYDIVHFNNASGEFVCVAYGEFLRNFDVGSSGNVGDYNFNVYNKAYFHSYVELQANVLIGSEDSAGDYTVSIWHEVDFNYDTYFEEDAHFNANADFNNGAEMHDELSINGNDGAYIYSSYYSNETPGSTDGFAYTIVNDQNGHRVFLQKWTSGTQTTASYNFAADELGNNHPLYTIATREWIAGKNHCLYKHTLSFNIGVNKSATIVFVTTDGCDFIDDFSTPTFQNLADILSGWGVAFPLYNAYPATIYKFFNFSFEIKPNNNELILYGIMSGQIESVTFALTDTITYTTYDVETIAGLDNVQ